jgi:hypothetical protein
LEFDSSGKSPALINIAGIEPAASYPGDLQKSSCPVGQITGIDSSSQNLEPAPGTGRGLFESDSDWVFTQPVIVRLLGPTGAVAAFERSLTMFPFCSIACKRQISKS